MLWSITTWNILADHSFTHISIFFSLCTIIDTWLLTAFIYQNACHISHLFSFVVPSIFTYSYTHTCSLSSKTFIKSLMYSAHFSCFISFLHIPIHIINYFYTPLDSIFFISSASFKKGFLILSYILSYSLISSPILKSSNHSTGMFMIICIFSLYYYLHFNVKFMSNSRIFFSFLKIFTFSEK